MWRKALTGVPRVSKEQWTHLNIPTKWLIATRASVLIMTILASFIAGILAYTHSPSNFDGFIFFLLVLGLSLDWSRGVDQDNYFRNRYGTHPMTVMSKNEMIAYLVVTGLSALSVGLILIYLRGAIVLYLTLSGAFFLLFYTWPLKIMGLGEVSVFVVWGILMIGGGFYTITSQWNWSVCLASIPYSLGVTAVIMGKHIDKLPEDEKKKINTLPVLLGDERSRRLVIHMFLGQYVATLYLIYIGFFSPWMLCTFVSLVNFPSVWRVYSSTKPETAPKSYPEGVWPLYYVAVSFKQNAIFGALFTVGLVLDMFFG